MWSIKLWSYYKDNQFFSYKKNTNKQQKILKKKLIYGDAIDKEVSGGERAYLKIWFCIDGNG